MSSADQFAIGVLICLVLWIIVDWNKGEDDYKQPESEAERKRMVKQLAEKGVSQNSMYYHTMAWCMENNISGKYHISNGNPASKRFLFNYDEETEVHVFLDTLGIWNIRMVASEGVDRDNQDAEEIIDKLKEKHPEIIFDRIYSKKDGNIIKWYTIGCTMDVDATKEDARYYVPGFVEDVLKPVNKELEAAFLKRSKETAMPRHYYYLGI